MNFCKVILCYLNEILVMFVRDCGKGEMEVMNFFIILVFGFMMMECKVVFFVWVVLNVFVMLVRILRLVLFLLLLILSI